MPAMPAMPEGRSPSGLSDTRSGTASMSKYDSALGTTRICWKKRY